MKQMFVGIVVSLLCGSASIAAEGGELISICGGFDAAGLIEGRPVIRVEPVVGAELREDKVESCIVVAYGLKEKRGSDGAALLVYRPKAVAQSDDVTKKEKKAAERALAKWLFLAKTHDAAKKPIYYSIITF